MPDDNTLSAADLERRGVTLDDMLPTSATLGTVDIGDVTIATATVVPSGPERGTALLVPGFTSSRSTFYCIMQQLADAGFRSVAIAQRGQPGSSGPDDVSGYSLDRLAADLGDVVDALEISGRVHLLGHSFGGVVGTEAIVARPDRWASFTLWNSGARHMGDEAGLGEALAGLREHGPRVLWIQDRLDKGLDPDVDLRGEMNPVEEFYFNRLMGTNPAQLEAGLTIMMTQRDARSDLASTKVPLLVSHGANDDAWPISQQQEDAQTMGADYRVVPNAGHSAHQDNPVDSVATLTAFWSAAPSGTSA